MTLGEKIRAARLELRLTQEQLGGRDFTKSYISELERGVRTPRRTTLKILARRLRRPLSYFLAGVPDDWEAEAFLHIGLAHLHAGALEEARASLERALELAMNKEDESLQGRIEMLLAVADQRLGHLSRALRRLDRTLRTLSRAQNPVYLARAHACLGSVKLEAGDAASAVWAFKAALRLADQVPHDPLFLAHLYHQLGMAHRSLGQTEEERDALDRALELAKPFRDVAHAGAWYLELAAAAARENLFEQAAEEAAKSLAISETILQKRRLAGIYQNLAEADLKEGRWGEAQEHYRWSVLLNGAVGNSQGVAETLGCFAEALLERASPEVAQVVCRAALDLLPAEGDPHERAHLMRIQGTIYRSQAKLAEAKAAFDESLRLFEELRSAKEARLVRQELALLALEAEDLATARHHLTVMREAPPHRGAFPL